VPLLPIQQEIVARCPDNLRVLLYRRFMLRLAERFAARFGARALVTGESLGQVASQTIENLAAVEAVATLPVLRPLIGLDKQEIIALARRLGSYETSILPHMDCCTYFVPDRPETRATAATLEEAESALDVEGLLDLALSSTEMVRIREEARWKEIPPPPGTEELTW
jgi:thiamine biosynthesis protein ThiI